MQKTILWVRTATTPLATATLGLLAVLVGSLWMGCAGGSPQMPGGTGADLMKETVAGAQTCPEPGGEDANLFLVQWDATDLSSFEAQAERDVVFVRYEGCEMKVLYGCSDSGVAGRYGTYGKPRWTSGTIESIQIETQDELYAQLPLGAANFSGELSQGRALAMQYYVTGTAAATRDDIYRADLSGNPRCEGATHFVWSYNLGAFSLAANQSTKAAAEATVAGYGGGGSTARDEEIVKTGGDISNCTSQDQRSCRVPIRITLRGIRDSEPPSVAEKMESVTPNQAESIQEANLNAAQNMMNGAQLRFAAEQKLMAKDGAGCLAELDRAERMDRQNARTPQIMMLRGRCQMAAGSCTEGKATIRSALVTMDADRRKSDATLDYEVQKFVDDYCASAATGGVAPGQQIIQSLQGMQMALAQNNADDCNTLGHQMIDAFTAMNPQTRQSGAYSVIPMMVQKASTCVASAGRCQEAKALFSKAWPLQNPDKAGNATALQEDFEFWVSECKGK
ncbi:MAG: hypothetical protein AAFS10_02355 [Myxococcota bacterium]